MFFKIFSDKIYSIFFNQDFSTLGLDEIPNFHLNVQWNSCDVFADFLHVCVCVCACV